jgi:hypothetical protein
MVAVGGGLRGLKGIHFDLSMFLAVVVILLFVRWCVIMSFEVWMRFLVYVGRGA